MKITPKIAESGISSYEQGFENFFETLRPSLKPWDYFVNWEKVYRNTNEIEIHLNIWNYLLGKENFDAEFDKLLEKHPQIVEAIPYLVVRDGDATSIFNVIEDFTDLTKPDTIFDFSKPAKTKEDRKLALRFVKETGLIKLFAKEGVKNLVDYVIGVEAGLDSNGRKNRSGTSMEKVVSSYLDVFIKGKGLEFIDQATPKKIKEKWGFIVPVDKASRRFDFAICDGEKLILMEVNFYGGGGSKLKATAGEYRGLNNKLRAANYNFVWITDGNGWHTTKDPLEDAYRDIDYIWNLNWLSRGYLQDLFEM